MRIEAYLTEVVSHIRSKEAKRFVQLELENHLQAVKEDLLKRGRSEEEAELVAIKQMGDSTLLGQKMNKLHRPKIDWLMLTGFVVLIGLSFLPLLYLQDTYDMNLVVRKTIYSIFGLVLVFSCLFFDYRKLSRFGYLFFCFGIVFLLLVNTSSFILNGRPILYVAGFTIEASYTLPFFLLAWASILGNFKEQTWMKITIEAPETSKFTTFNIRQALWKLALLYILSVLLLLPSANLFLILLYTVLVIVMVIFSPITKKDKYIFAGGISISVLISALVTIITQPYMVNRFKAFLHPNEYGNYPIIKAKEYIGNAGWFGQALPKDGLGISASHTDFIFVTLTYGHGWLLAGLLVILLIGLSVRMVINLKSMQDSFGRLLTIGGITLYTLSFSWSILMSIGLVPYVGVSLPFFSYGLMPTLLHSFFIGMVLSVYRRKDLVSLTVK